MRLRFAVRNRSFCHDFLRWARALAASAVRGRNPAQFHALLRQTEVLAGVRQHVEAVPEARVHGVVHRVHAIERVGHALDPHLVAKLERPAPGTQQVAGERQPARVAAVAARNARVVGRKEGLAVGLAGDGFVGGGRHGIHGAGAGAAASGRVRRCRAEQHAQKQ